MFMQVIASAGPLTGIFEAVATSIGAGIVVGSFALGGLSFANGWPRTKSEGLTLVGGHIGGLVGLLLLSIDTLAKHVV